MASGGTLDLKVMTLEDKDGTVQKMAFSAALKYSSTEKAWNDHEERLAQHFQSILDLDNDFEELKQKEASAFSPMTDLAKACLKYIDASRKYNNEYTFGLPMLKNRYKEERNKVKKEMDNEIAQKFEKWFQMFFPMKEMMRLPEVLIKESDFMIYCKLSGQWFHTRDEILQEKANIDNLMKEGARIIRVKSALAKKQEKKDVLDKVLKQQRSLLKPEHLNFVAQKDHELKELETLLQKGTIECINYVDPVESSAEASTEKDNVRAVETSDQQTLESENQPNPNASLTAHDKLDRSLKLLKHSNEPSLLSQQTENSPGSANLVALGESQRRSIVDFSGMRTFRASEPSQKLGSKVGSDTSKLSERRRLQVETKLMEQESQMEIEKKRRELAVMRKQQEMELEELQAQLEIANLESQNTLRQQQMQFKIEEAEGSIKASSISGNLMSLGLTDRNSDIKSWLDQGEKESDEVLLLPKKSQDQRDSSRDKTLTLLNSKSNLERKSTNQPDRSRLIQKELAIKPISLTQKLVSPNEAHSTNDFTEKTDVKPNNNVLPPPGFVDFKPKNKYEFAKPAIKTEPYFQPHFSAVPLTQMSTQVMHVSIPKSKISKFNGDPLEWPEWSNLFTATIHNAPIDDNAKMGHLKTLVKGKAKAAIAGLGYSGSMYTAAWNALVTNFGSPQTIVKAEMKLIHTSPIIKSHDSAAIIKYAQLITTCVNVLKQYGFDGDLYSESVLNSALRKLPPELKFKWFFLAKSKNY